MPFHTVSQASIVPRVLRGERPEIPTGIDDVVYEVIQDCWLDDPDKRPTAAELAERLKCYSKESIEVQ